MILKSDKSKKEYTPETREKKREREREKEKESKKNKNKINKKTWVFNDTNETNINRSGNFLS